MKKETGYWDNWDNLEKELKCIIQNLGHFPTQKELRTMKRNDILKAVTFFDGLVSVGTKMGYAPKHRPNGYWDEKNMALEFKQACISLDRFPLSSSELKDNFPALYSAICKKYDHYADFLTRMNVEPLQKPDGYWKEWDNFAIELQKVIDELGYFPTQKELAKKNLNSLAIYISRYGGKEKVADELGINLNYEMFAIDGHKVRSNYELILDNFLHLNNIYHESENFIDENSDKKYMYDFKVKTLDNEYLYIEIWGYVDGRYSISSKIGKKYMEKKKEKEKFYKEKGLKLVGLNATIFKKTYKKTFSNLVELCKKYNLKKTDFCTEYDKIIASDINFINFKEELQFICEQLGRFPTSNELNGKEHLKTYIKNNGGYYKTAAMFGYKTFYDSKNKKHSYHWNDFENIKKELIPICIKMGRMPSSKELGKLGKRSLYDAIRRKHGGINKVAQKLGYLTKNEATSKKDAGYWKNFNNFEDKMISLCKSLNRFPTHLECKKIGLSYSILNKYHGGYKKVAKRLGFLIYEEYVKKTSDEYWRNFNNLKKELSPLCNKLGRFPTNQELKTNNMSIALSAIRKFHGGSYNVAKKMNLPTSRKTKSKNNTEHLINNDLISLCKKLGRFPSNKELIDNGLSVALKEIQKHKGGVDSFAKELGYLTIMEYKAQQTFLRIKNEAKEQGFDCLTEEYINNKANMKWRCNKGHVFECSFSVLACNRSFICTKCKS